MYLGKGGYTFEGLNSMYTDELFRHGNLLNKRLEDEVKAQQLQAQQRRSPKGPSARVRFK